MESSLVEADPDAPAEEAVPLRVLLGIALRQPTREERDDEDRLLAALPVEERERLAAARAALDDLRAALRALVPVEARTLAARKRDRRAPRRRGGDAEARYLREAARLATAVPFDAFAAASLRRVERMIERLTRESRLAARARSRDALARLRAGSRPRRPGRLARRRPHGRRPARARAPDRPRPRLAERAGGLERGAA